MRTCTHGLPRYDLLEYAHNNRLVVPRDLLVRAFADMTNSRVEAVHRSTTFLDVRAATDPESRGYAGHCGEHPHIMLSVSEHALHYGWFGSLRKCLRTVAQQHDCKLEQNLVFICKSGKHRSVAMAFLTHELLRRTASYQATLPVACGQYWGSLARCGGPVYCQACGDTRSPLLKTAFGKAKESWDQELITAM